MDSVFARHLMSGNHDPESFENSSFPLHLHITCNKGAVMNAIEEFEIYSAIKKDPNKVLNEKLKFKNNSLFNTVIELYDKQW